MTRKIFSVGDQVIYIENNNILQVRVVEVEAEADKESIRYGLRINGVIKSYSPEDVRFGEVFYYEETPNSESNLSQISI
ncbi:MAG: hypothetical protein Q7S27_06035 [Nanoarchaeota archaeon]|nr:hypothetical protein [Nanoarchaeota archaeon]